MEERKWFLMNKYLDSIYPMSGRMIREDGTIFNVADGLSKGSAAINKSKFPIDSMSPMTGRMIREDGSVVNIAELIEVFVNSGGGSITPEQIQQAVNDYLEQHPVSADTSEVSHGTGDTTFELTPNTFHTWGEVTSLNLTLAAGKDGVVNEYMFAFTSGATATVLSLPESVKTDIIVEPNTRYECSIVGNYMVFNDWSVADA